VNALARPEVGKYLDEYFVSTYQKVGTFKIVGGQKQGGNVASYFTTPEGRVLHAIAGPVDAATLLREARWVEETWKLARLEGKDSLLHVQAAFRKAHLDRLKEDLGANKASLSWSTHPTTPTRMPAGAEAATPAKIMAILDQAGTDQQERLHRLLATYPLIPIDRVYKPIFEKVLGETVSTSPVDGGKGI
jgi:hypothetical protein